MQAPFEIDSRLLGGDGFVVAVRGDIDLFTTPDLKQAMAAAIASGATTVFVDLRHTTFLDSSSLGVLIGAHRRLQRTGGRMVVACDEEPVLKVLRITGLDGVFEMATTVPERSTASRAA